MISITAAIEKLQSKFRPTIPLFFSVGSMPTAAYEMMLVRDKLSSVLGQAETHLMVICRTSLCRFFLESRPTFSYRLRTKTQTVTFTNKATFKTALTCSDDVCIATCHKVVSMLYNVYIFICCCMYSDQSMTMQP